MAKTMIYKFYLTYTHTIDGKLGRTMEFPANNDTWARAIASKEFDEDENSHFGLLVKKDGRNDVIVSTFEHEIF